MKQCVGTQRGTLDELGTLHFNADFLIKSIAESLLKIPFNEIVFL